MESLLGQLSFTPESTEYLILCAEIGNNLLTKTRLEQMEQVEHVGQQDFETTGNSSAAIGEFGENYVQDILSEEYLIDTSGYYNGDIILSEYDSSDRYKIMVEIKNYHNPVNQKEIGKFYRDIYQNPHVSGGLFISLRSTISSMTKSIEYRLYKFGGRDIFVIYLHSFNPEIIKACAKILFIKNKDRVVSTSTLQEHFNSIEPILGQLNKMYGLIERIKMYNVKELQKIQVEILSMENRLESSLKVLGDNLEFLGKEETTTKNDFLKNMEDLVDFKQHDNKVRINNIIDILLLDEFDIQYIAKNKIKIFGVVDFIIVIYKSKINLEFNLKYLSIMDIKSLLPELCIDQRAYISMPIKKRYSFEELCSFKKYKTIVNAFCANTKLLITL